MVFFKKKSIMHFNYFFASVFGRFRAMKLQKDIWSSLSLMFFDQAKKFSTRPFLWFKEKESYKSLSWSESAQQILKITHALISNDVVEGDRIVIVSENRPEWLIADLAIITCGAITVPAYTTYTTDDYLHILSNCKANGIIVSNQSLAEKLSSILQKITDIKFIITMEDGKFESHKIRSMEWGEILKKPLPESTQLKDLEKRSSRKKAACIIYTSGTGGKPKGVVLSHGSILHNCEGAREMLSDLGGHNDTFLSFLPLSHSYEHTAGQFFPIFMGASIYYSEGIEKLKTKGDVSILTDNLEWLREEEVVSNTKRVSNSYQIKDKNKNYFRPQLSFKPVVPSTKKVDSDTMNKMRDEFKLLVEKYCEHITTDVSIPTVKSVSS